jgi:RNA polymerase sigma-70 factor (ECF subfamily)
MSSEQFNRIYASTNKAVLALITAKCRQTSDINDIFQDTYMELWEVLNKRGADYVKNEKAFVVRLAKQRLSRHYSFLERLRFTTVRSVDCNGDSEEASDLLEKQADSFLTEEFVVNSDLIERAKKLISSKPEQTQKIFYLFYDVELSIPEIAKALSISESNVKNKLYRTLGELRRLLS